MSPAEIAATHPDKPAYIMAETGETITFAQLEAFANQGAQLFRSLGLQRGDHIAILLENHSRFFSNLLGCTTGGPVLHGNQLATAAAGSGLHRQQL